MQFQYLGGAVGLGVVTTILNNNLRPQLAFFLDPADVSRMIQSTEFINQLPVALQQDVQHVFGESFGLQ